MTITLQQTFGTEQIHDLTDIPIHPLEIELCRIVDEEARRLGIPFLVVGAKARDYLIELSNPTIRLNSIRATKDYDFGIRIPSWDSFYGLSNALKARGFTGPETPERQYHLKPPADWQQAFLSVDIVPFGSIVNEKDEIEWPGSDIVMSAQGFEEAHNNAWSVRLAKAPDLVVRILGPEGLCLLKLISWSERQGKRASDAGDLGVMLWHYEFFKAYKSLSEDSLFDLLDRYGWEYKQANVHLLASAVHRIASTNARKLILDIFDGNHVPWYAPPNKPLNKDILITEMHRQLKMDMEPLVAAFENGFREAGRIASK